MPSGPSSEPIIRLVGGARPRSDRDESLAPLTGTEEQLEPALIAGCHGTTPREGLPG